MARIRKNDMVEMIAGNDSGVRGRVLRVIPSKSRLVVQGVNLRWKHLRKSQQNPQGGRVRRETPVHISNVMLYDAEAGVRTRVGFASWKRKLSPSWRSSHGSPSRSVAASPAAFTSASAAPASSPASTSTEKRRPA